MSFAKNCQEKLRKKVPEKLKLWNNRHRIVNCSWVKMCRSSLQSDCQKLKLHATETVIYSFLIGMHCFCDNNKTMQEANKKENMRRDRRGKRIITTIVGAHRTIYNFNILRFFSQLFRFFAFLFVAPCGKIKMIFPIAGGRCRCRCSPTRPTAIFYTFYTALAVTNSSDCEMLLVRF